MMEGKERQAVIAEIQRFCIHDGPGIRTTVFFKGCPLSCDWCHNPETQKREPEMLFFSDSCIGCKSCQAVCERGAHRWTKEGHTLDLSRCAFCGKKEECARACPTGAMKVCGRKFSADKLLEEVLADRPFYGKTGGVTCSGGEPLAQAFFLAQFLPLCKEKGLHVCLDTSLNAEWETIELLLPYIDLFLADVKCLDPKKARRYTKADARLSRENLLRLSEKKRSGNRKKILFLYYHKWNTY